MSMIWSKAVEWYKEVDSLEDNSPTDTDQSGDVYQIATVGSEWLVDWRDTICQEDFQAGWLI